MSISRTRRIGTLLDGRSQTASDKRNRAELDSHADTCCAGINTVPFSYSEETVTVSPFLDAYTPLKKVKIASVVTAYDDPITGDTLFLVIHETLYFGDRLPQTLLNPNQLRYHGNKVHDVPKQFDPDSQHAIEIPSRNLVLPLGLDGIISYLPTRKPTQEEMTEFRKQSPDTWIELTSDVAWRPYSKEFRDAEHRCTQDLRSARKVETGDRTGDKVDSLHRSISVAKSVRERSPYDFLNEETMADRLIMRVNVAADDVPGDGLSGRLDDEIYPTDEDDRVLMKMKSSERGSVVTKEILARRWGIGLETAKRTLRSTTQAGIRRVLDPSER
jgi:hypothetical protein